MTMTVGIDISKDWLDVALHPGAAAGARFRNDGPGHAALIAWLRTLGDPARIVFEATGAYHRALALALERAGRPYCKVNPRRARRFTQAAGRLAKTDRIARMPRFQRDAAMLARMGQVLELEPDRPLGEKQDDLNALTSARQALVEDRTALLARRATTGHALVLSQLDRRKRAIEADIAEIDAALAELVRSDEALRTREAILVSIPGLAATSATTILAQMPELGAMGGKQAAAMAGVAPSPAARASGGGAPSSAAAGRPCAARATCRRSSPPASTPTCAPPTSASSRPESRRSWRWSRSCASSESSPTPSSAKAGNGRHMPLDQDGYCACC